jgi:hypothetical protein
MWFRPGQEVVAGRREFGREGCGVGWRGRGQRDLEPAALHAAQDVDGADLAALVEREQEARADEQQAPAALVHQHRP